MAKRRVRSTPPHAPVPRNQTDSGTVCLVRATGCSVMEKIQSRALPEPFELGGAERVVQPERLAGSVSVLDAAFDRLPGRHLFQPHQAQPVIGADAVVIGR